MLVLTRNISEVIVIKHNDILISFKILEVRGNKIRIGFIAPKDIIINRFEVENVEIQNFVKKEFEKCGEFC